jgi:ribose transport system ATP-binding protein
MTIAQNVFLGKELPANIRLFVSRAKMRREASEILKRVNLKVDVSKAVQDCRVGQQQMVEIAKAVGANSWVVVMDEPTAALTEDDKEKLFDIIRDLKEQGVAIRYISHRMAEIFSIADEVTVLRDGKHVITAPMSEMNEHELIKHMVGREISDVFARERAEQKEVVLEVKNLWRKGVFEPISFEVRAGEVLGFSGLMGAGRTEIMRCLFGLDKADGGEIFVNGKKSEIRSPQDAIKAGICLVSEDRRREGIIPTLSVRENIAIPSLPNLSKGGFVEYEKEEELAVEYVDKLSIKTPTTEQSIANLSGGNQQKVCLAKWLALNPNVIIMDEPTRGVDVGAKAEIHKLIEGLAKEGIAVIMISSELPEILGVSDRIIVLYEGKKTGEINVDKNVTQETIMKSAAGLH